MELHEQVDRLVEAGWPAAAALSETAFRALAGPLEAALPDAPYVLAAAPSLVPALAALRGVRLDGREAFTSMESDDVARFVPTPDLDVPSDGLYLLVDVDTGTDTLGVRPDDALPLLHARGRTPLTLEEGLAVATLHPEWLRERNCFELLGSRCGDKRVTGLWLSKRQPRLGWCWGGNPHTWLGMASAARRAVPVPA